MTPVTGPSIAHSMGGARLRFVALLTCLLIDAGAAQGQNTEIPYPAPNGGGTEIWVDMNPAGNTATSVASIERCRTVAAADGIFQVDIVVFNAPLFQKMWITLTFDPAYVQVLDVSDQFLLYSQGGTRCEEFPCSFPLWEIINGNSVRIYTWTTSPFGGAGTGVLARIVFQAKAPFGQSGFDITEAHFWDGAGTQCCLAAWHELPVDSSPGIAQGYFDPTGTVGCWTVTSTDDIADPAIGNGICDVDPAAGVVKCSLRAGIQESNAIGGTNRVSFRIPDDSRTCGPPCTTVSPDLPSLSDATGGTTIDGSTHSAMVLNAAGGTGDAILITSASNVVKGLTIQSAVRSGVRIDGGSTNRILGCRIGTNHLGTVAAANGRHGVEIVNASSNQVGGVAAGEGNLIAAHGTGAGVAITGGTSNLVRGNTIGLNALGARLPNGYGIIMAATSFDTIGGSIGAARNVISGNTSAGIQVGNSHHNVIQGNYIGTDAAGIADRFNGTDGITVANAPNNQIGGPTISAGTPPGNLISANARNGIFFPVAGATGNRVRGNRIGLDALGLPLRNGNVGIEIFNANDNVIGGETADEANVISSNRFHGVHIRTATGTLVQGNIIGLDDTGFFPRPNGIHGVFIENASSNTIGGQPAAPGIPPGNVISANAFDGVHIEATAGAGNNIVSGNVIGLDVAGNEDGNSNGVQILNSPGNLIGGTVSTARNVISGNLMNGITITTSNQTEVYFNYIGTDPTGFLDRGNLGHGIAVGACMGTKIGGTAYGNLISGNDGHGIDITGYAFPNTTVLGNTIGTDVSRAAVLGNGAAGINLWGATQNNVIGSGPAPNVISGNGDSGINLTGGGTNANVVRGNLIGVDGTGSVALPNARGVWLSSGAQFNEIGGALAGNGNLISGNLDAGVLISDLGTNSNRVELNTIGADVGRTIPVPNSGSGVRIENGAAENTIVDNAIEGNAPHGVEIVGGAAGFASNNEVLDNFVGSASIPNTDDGIHIGPGARFNVLTLNLVGNNGGDGVEIQGADAEGNLLTGNSLLGNDGSGLRISAQGIGNVIGGFIPEARNLIRGNGLDGVTVEDGFANALFENLISLNNGLGIDLNDDGVTANDGPPDADGGANDLQNAPVLTSATAGGGATTVVGSLSSAANTVYRIEFFSDTACDPSGFGEGAQFLGFTHVTTDATGAAAINQVVGSVPIGQVVTATATDTTLYDTSEFSACVAVVGAPIAAANLAIRSATSLVSPVAGHLPSKAGISAQVGDTLEYSLFASNSGPDGSTGVAVVDSLPAGVSFVSSVSSQGACTGTSVVTCDVGAMAVDDTVTIAIRVVPGAPGTIINTAVIAGNEPDPDLSNNTTRDTTDVAAPTASQPAPRPLPTEVWLGQNLPNPFNPRTTIPFALPAAAPVRLAIYDSKGQLVRLLLDESRPAGYQQVEWNGRDRKGRLASTGQYFYALDTPWGRSTRRMLLLK